jgi:hypothetical protein
MVSKMVKKKSKKAGLQKTYSMGYLLGKKNAHESMRFHIRIISSLCPIMPNKDGYDHQ